jgi:CRP-like cAMP-binding protein
MADRLFDQLTLFQDLDSYRREQIAALFQPFFGEIGDIIFEQGDAAEYLYLVLDGEVTVRYKPEDGPPLVVARVHPEGVVGWSAALGSPSYTSGAICTLDTTMVRVRGADLRALCESNPETGALLLERLATVIAQRLSNTHHQVLSLLEQGLRLHGQVLVHRQQE